MSVYTDNIHITTGKTVKRSLRFRNVGLICLAVLILVIFCLEAKVYSDQVIVRWNANTEADLAGYKLFYGTSTANYEIIDDVGDVTTHTITDLVKGVTYFIALTAYDTFDNESGFSEELIYSVPMDPIDPIDPIDPMDPLDDPVEPILLNLTLSKNSTGRSTLLDDVIVTVKDQNGNLMSDILVEITTKGRGVVVDSNSARTDVNGKARFRFRFKLIAKDGEVIFSVGSSTVALTQLKLF